MIQKAIWTAYRYFTQLAWCLGCLPPIGTISPVFGISVVVSAVTSWVSHVHKCNMITSENSHKLVTKPIFSIAFYGISVQHPAKEVKISSWQDQIWPYLYKVCCIFGDFQTGAYWTIIFSTPDSVCGKSEKGIIHPQKAYAVLTKLQNPTTDYSSDSSLQQPRIYIFLRSQFKKEYFKFLWI